VNWIDWVAVGLVVLFALKGYQRGLIGQLATFLAVGLGVLAGLYLHEAALSLLPDFGVPELSFAISFAVVFAAVALSVFVLGRLLRGAVRALFLGGVDRILGGVFGLLVGIQGLLIVVLLVSRHIPEGGDFLQQTRLAPVLFGLAERLLPLLPDDFGRFFEGRLPDPEEVLRALDRRLSETRAPSVGQPPE
jgi:membrane protein required for colicin V production